MGEEWVVDASTLIILGKLSLIHILPALNKGLIIPEGVVTEIERGPEFDKAKIWIQNEGKKYIRNIGEINLKVASWDLGLGETEVISYCLSNRQCYSIIDDRAARECARSFSINMKGTLALLITAKNEQIISYVKPYLRRMIKEGFRIDSKLINRILNIVKE